MLFVKGEDKMPVNNSRVLGPLFFYNSKWSFIECLTFARHFAQIISTPCNHLAKEIVLILIYSQGN